MHAFEKLGSFYLGQLYDLEAGARQDGLLLYDSRDLTTHAVCVGMTGSGKTGLCIGLLEEAALDGVPAIAIDPKGDIGNLLLTFPDLAPADFRPWIDEDAAARKGVTPDAYAASQAELWRQGLADWGQDGERIRRLRESAEFTIYTPGSTAGRPLSILRSFAAPPVALVEDAELLADRVETTATGVLGLLGVDADPLQSREHILLSTILTGAWAAGHDLDVAALIQAIQQPPFDRVGVMDLDAFFPPDDRHALALRLNNLLASPGFQTWLLGEPLDIGALLHTEGGKPRVSILSVAHLSEAERMFFVSLLLNEIVGWTRSQSGTSSLRALVYMDEIFGFFPPVANPPSKKPLLTLLKQARAYGVGIVLATQNPVDLDYKGLSNAGTWFIGRLQAERDKARVMEGLEGASSSAAAGFDRGRMEATIAGLDKRVFLMNNVHEDRPAVFHTRWVMSYLRGPLTRAEIKRLSDSDGRPSVAETPSTTAPVSAPPAPGPTTGSESRPVLPPRVPEHFVAVRQRIPDGQRLHYLPRILASAEYRIVHKKTASERVARLTVATPVSDDAVPVNWDEAQPIEVEIEDLQSTPEALPAAYADVPRPATDPKRYTAWKREWKDWLYRNQTLTLWYSPTFKAFSWPDETERDFRARLDVSARERRDAEKEKLTQKYAAKLARLEDQIRTAEQRVEREQEQARDHKLQTAISLGATVLGSVLGRKTMSRSTLGRATTTARNVGRSMKQSGDVDRARETLADRQEKLEALDAEFQAALDELEDRFDPAGEPLEEIVVRPFKKDINVTLVALGWLPHWEGEGGALTPAWT